MGQEGGVMGQRRKFSAEYKREAVAMLDVPGVTVSQVATELGIGANVLGGGDASCADNPRQPLWATDALAMRNWPSFVGS
jgi:hypothetical protein